MTCAHTNTKILYFSSYLGKKKYETHLAQAFTVVSDVVNTKISPCEQVV